MPLFNPASGGADLRPIQATADSGTITEPGTGANAFGYATGAGSAITAGGQGSTAFGLALAGGEIESTATGNYGGGLAFGRANNAYYTTSLISAARSSMAFGQSYGGTIEATGFSGLAGGYVQDSGVISAGNAAIAFGWAHQSGSSVSATGYGSIAVGSAQGTIQATGRGSQAFGFALNSGSILASGYGSHASGHADLAGSTITGSGKAATASGYATGSGSTIVASGVASQAFGYASAGADIVASATGAVQFAPGTNAVANSLAVGADIRFHADGAPGTPRNGDQWVASDKVFLRSNGISVAVLAEDFEMACSDESTAITTTGIKLTRIVRRAEDISSYFAQLNVACTTGTFTIDVLKNAVSVLSTLITIDATERSTLTAATPAVVSTTAWAAGDIMTISVTNVGDSNGAGLKVVAVRTAT